MDSNVKWSVMTDGQLAVLVRSGESAAYDELVSRHRGSMMRVAMSITKDPFMAEDAVQEALLRAYIEIGTLRQPERVFAWLRRIVRNCALMAVRRGGPFAKELPFAVLMGPDGERQTEDALDQALGKLARRELLAREDGANPLELTLRGETADMSRQLLGALHGRERVIFEAHAVHQYTTGEISRLLSTTPSNIYSAISRSRAKLQALHYEMNLTRMLKERMKDGAAHPQVELAMNEVYFGEIWESFALNVLYAAQFTERSHYSIADIMGLTGLAFRLQMNEARVDLIDTTAFHWPSVYARGLEQLGFAARCFNDGRRTAAASDRLLEAYSFVQHSLDEGRPVIVWGIKQRFFGLIYGYDDRSRRFRVVGLFEETVIPYEELGKGWSADLFALSLGSFRPLQASASLIGALKAVVEHAEGAERLKFANHAYGLEAYLVWIAHLESGNAAPYDNAYMIWCTSNNRQFAVQFLQDVARQPELYGVDGEQVAQLALEAAAWYEAATESLQRLKRLFPFPKGGQPDAPEAKAEGAALLRRVYGCEQEGVRLLKLMLRLLQK